MAKAKSPFKGSTRFRQLNHFMDDTLSKVTRTEAVVWLYLYRHARPIDSRKQKWVAARGYRPMAKDMGADTKTVKQSIHSLRSKGLLVCIRNGQQTGIASEYAIFPNIDPERQHKKQLTPWTGGDC